MTDTAPTDIAADMPETEAPPVVTKSAALGAGAGGALAIGAFALGAWRSGPWPSVPCRSAGRGCDGCISTI